MSSSTQRKTLKFGVIGAGYMGKAYAIALGSVGATFELSANPVRELLATTQQQSADAKAAALGFNRATADWQSLVRDTAVDVVGICSPTHVHKEMALAAIAAGKHVLCEKPLALSPREAEQMAQAAEQAGVKTLVGFNYIKNPATQLARQMITNGEIGDIVHFRATHNEDYLVDPQATGGWRLQERFASKAGALGDLASHIINLAHYLCGPIAEVIGESQIIHRQRPGDDGTPTEVENDDQTNFLVKFASGVLGSFEASRIAAGRKMGLTYEVIGTKGSLFFDQERMAELQYYSATDPAERSGYKTLLIGPQHPDYGQFCIGSGHGFGYNDMIVVEMRDLIEGIVADRPLWPTFRDAVHTALVVDAVLVSQRERRWVSIEERQQELQQ
ncbi:myo-inositol 2-dehydrogenase [Pokkaliibacter plantistimulans]|uniref:Myo-inositol 2-dehydrogenase n=1 Tax=Proteobacteria bacterium 228 TaxID=2083153 RepID=A0A2S5KTB2_9PROT|nr:Gfo/Idh/MocA family oxidoreductase [Pokkaliibacter plantistimulans]PPC77506.1 myo-inositol 2-dehydrogenase [Pokkaliibacter plantistimulans]